jgi:hypothetical protein
MVKTKNFGIRKIIGTNQEQKILTAIQNFSCRDKGVEDFLKNKAIDFDKRHKSRTYLIIDTERYDYDEFVILGYYTLTIKTLEFSETLSKSTIKRIDGFSKDVLATEAILIGQLGKNQEYQEQIDGQEILFDALDTAYSVHEIAGGRIVFLECDEIPKLIDFYTRNGFEPLQKSGDYLQMIRYL